MTNSQLNFARTGASALGGEFTSSYGPNGADRLVLEDGAPSAPANGARQGQHPRRRRDAARPRQGGGDARTVASRSGGASMSASSPCTDW